MSGSILRVSLFALAIGSSIGAAAACSSSPSPASGDAAAPPVDAASDAGAPPEGALSLAPGEAAEIAVDEGTANVVLATTGGESFVAIVASTSLDAPRSDHAYTVGPSTGPRGRATKLDGCALSSATWAGVPVPPEAPPAGVAPAVGTTRSLVVPVGTRLETITAEVVATSASAVVWADTTAARPATLDPAFVSAFLADFDANILPRERALFGVESDTDGDGRVSLVFSPLTKDSAVAFFRQCDLSEGPGCGPGAGNRGEYLYLTPPADIAPPYDTPAAIKEILAHELGHLLHYNRKVLRNRLSSWPDAAYMIEGFGGFAQDASGFQSGNLYVTKAGLDGIGDFSIAEVLGARSSYDTKRDGVLRGGAYLFVRYLYDKAGADTIAADGSIEGKGGTAFLRAVLDAPGAVASRVAEPQELADVTMDFYTALLLSGSEKAGGTAPKNRCFAFGDVAIDPLTKKPRGADPYASFHGQSMKGPKVQKLSTADGKLRPGGVEYLAFEGAPDGAETTLSVAVPIAAAPRVRVVRMR